MSLQGIYNIGESALIASQAALSVTSNNVANVNTPGYSEEAVTLNISNPNQTGEGSIGTGVKATGVTRNYSQFINAQLLTQQQNQSASSATSQTWGQVQQVMNEDQGIGLSTPLSNFFNDWSDVATSPDSSAARTTLLQDAGTLVTTAQSIAGSLNETVANANKSITSDAGQINTIASEIAVLNQQIVQQGTNGSQPNELLDQRDEQLTALAQLTNFNTYNNSDGSITVEVGGQNIVSGSLANTMSTTSDTNGNQAVMLNGINITSSITGGDIGGQISSVNGIQNTTLTGLNTLITSLTLQVNKLNSAGFGLDGSTGNDFFNAPQLTTLNNTTNADITATVSKEANLSATAYNFTFSGGQYSVFNNQTGAQVAGPAAYTAGTPIDLSATLGMTVDIPAGAPATGSFTISPLTTAISNFGVAITDPNKVAAASTAAGVPGDSSNANLISQLAGQSMNDLGNETFSDYYSGIVSKVGSTAQSASDTLTFNNNLVSSLQSQQQAVSGVSLDEEATNLMLYQKSYDAAAQIITVTDQMVQTLLNIQTA